MLAFIGFPNEKIYYFQSFSAKPEIANYPFTTIVPNLGIVAYRNHQLFIMADIPGIIQSAHMGKGLGHRFLKAY